MLKSDKTVCSLVSFQKKSDYICLYAFSCKVYTIFSSPTKKPSRICPKLQEASDRFEKHEHFYVSWYP